MINHLNSTNFTWQNHGLNQGENGWRVLDPDLKNIPCNGYKVVGYCDGNELKIKPQNGFAVMFIREVDNVHFWLNVNDYEFEKLNK